MRKRHRPLLILLCVPFMTGCFGMITTPIPSLPSQRQAMDIGGVVESDGTRVEFVEVEDVTWTNDQIFIIGQREIDGTLQQVTNQYPLAGLDLTSLADAVPETVIVQAIGARVTPKSKKP